MSCSCCIILNKLIIEGQGRSTEISKFANVFKVNSYSASQSNSFATNVVISIFTILYYNCVRDGREFNVLLTF